MIHSPYDLIAVSKNNVKIRKPASAADRDKVFTAIRMKVFAENNSIAETNDTIPSSSNSTIGTSNAEVPSEEQSPIACTSKIEQDVTLEPVTRNAPQSNGSNTTASTIPKDSKETASNPANYDINKRKVRIHHGIKFAPLILKRPTDTKDTENVMPPVNNLQPNTVDATHNSNGKADEFMEYYNYDWSKKPGKSREINKAGVFFGPDDDYIEEQISFTVPRYPAAPGPSHVTCHSTTDRVEEMKEQSKNPNSIRMVVNTKTERIELGYIEKSGDDKENEEEQIDEPVASTSKAAIEADNKKLNQQKVDKKPKRDPKSNGKK